MNDLENFLILTLVKSAPLIFAAIAGVVCERAGILNIALEGTLAAGAFGAVAVTYATGSPALGIVAGMLCGALVSGTLGIAATRFGVDQIVAGTGLNVVAIAGAAFGVAAIWGAAGVSPEVRGLGNAGQAVLIVIAVALAFAVQAGLDRTAFGLRLRACGENPRAVRSAGIDPLRMRVIATLIAGAIAGLGGVYLSLAELSLYSDGMTAGRGFIALAAVIFGRWTPLGATGAALAFGALSALQFSLQRSGIPSEFMEALPYVVALLALGGLTGRARAPVADGVPYP
jgi:simple sugar transport system permease protein